MPLLIFGKACTITTCMGNNPHMTKSLEDYLEAIHRQVKKTGSARVVDISKTLGVTMPSVNSAVKELSRIGLIAYEKYHHIHMTPAGERRAAGIFKRHTLLKTFLLSIGVSDANAENDACSMEHILSEETVSRLEAATGSMPVERQAAKPGNIRPD